MQFIFYISLRQNDASAKIETFQRAKSLCANNIYSQSSNQAVTTNTDKELPINHTQQHHKKNQTTHKVK